VQRHEGCSIGGRGPRAPDSEIPLPSPPLYSSSGDGPVRCPGPSPPVLSGGIRWGGLPPPSGPRQRGSGRQTREFVAGPGATRPRPSARVSSAKRGPRRPRPPRRGSPCHGAPSVYVPSGSHLRQSVCGEFGWGGIPVKSQRRCPEVVLSVNRNHAWEEKAKSAVDAATFSASPKRASVV